MKNVWRKLTFEKISMIIISREQRLHCTSLARHGSWVMGQARGQAWWVGEGLGGGGRVLHVPKRVSVLGWGVVGEGGAWVRGACPPRTEACLCVGVGRGGWGRGVG